MLHDLGPGLRSQLLRFFSEQNPSLLLHAQYFLGMIQEDDFDNLRKSGQPFDLPLAMCAMQPPVFSRRTDLVLPVSLHFELSFIENTLV